MFMLFSVAILSIPLFMLIFGVKEPGEGITTASASLWILGFIILILIQWRIFLYAVDWIVKRQESIVEEKGIRLPLIGFIKFREEAD